ncbi:hypothetical protein J6590_065609 [Homalodisca vitripennis]|nr:hypothetical protein J6590_065609 [Homalodisca vitripennis]
MFSVTSHIQDESVKTALDCDKICPREMKLKQIQKHATPQREETHMQMSAVLPTHSQPGLSVSRGLSQDNQSKQRQAWLLLGWVTAERSCPCKQPACPAVGGCSEVTFKPLVPRLS